MSRFIASALLLFTLGCGRNEVPTAIVDPVRANAEVDSYVGLARGYIEQKEFDKATATLERAIEVEGATNREPAAKLLASVLPLQRGTPPAKPIDKGRYSSDMTPTQVVQGYLASQTWQDRLPFVLNPKTVGPLMANTYQNSSLDPSSFRPGTILPPEQKTASGNSTISIKVDMSESSPESPYWTYIVQKTEDGHKIDWESSQALSQAEKDATARRALQLDDPVLEVRILKVEPSGSSLEIHYRVTNRSNKYLRYWQFNVELEGAGNAYLGSTMSNGTNLGAGQSTIARTYIRDVPIGRVTSCKFQLGSVTIETGGQSTADATKYFTVEQKGARQ